MAKGDIGSQGFLNQALAALPNQQFGSPMGGGQQRVNMPGQQIGGGGGMGASNSMGGINPNSGIIGAGQGPMMQGGGLGPSFPQMLLQMAMRNQMQMPSSMGLNMGGGVPPTSPMAGPRPAHAGNMNTSPGSNPGTSRANTGGLSPSSQLMSRMNTSNRQTTRSAY